MSGDSTRVSDKVASNEPAKDVIDSTQYQVGKPLMQASDVKALRSLPGCSIDGADPFISTARMTQGGRPDEMNLLGGLFKSTPLLAMSKELAKSV